MRDRMGCRDAARWPAPQDCRCIVCGDVIPEGRQVCPICEAKAEGVMSCGKDPGNGSGTGVSDHVGGKLGVRLGRRKS